MLAFIAHHTWWTLKTSFSISARLSILARGSRHALEASRPRGSSSTTVTSRSWWSRVASVTRDAILAGISPRSLLSSHTWVALLTLFSYRSLVTRGTHRSWQTLQTLGSRFSVLSILSRLSSFP